MRTNDSIPSTKPTVRVPNRDAGYSLVPNRHTPASSRSANSQDAAADLSRQQIEAIYANDPNSLMSVEAEPTTANQSPKEAASLAAFSPAASSMPSPAPDPKPSYAYAPEPQTHADSNAPKILHGKAKFQSGRDIPVEKLIAENPYDRTHDETKLQANQDQWKQYHSAWQNYYQQYFHRYYAGYIEQMQQTEPASQTTVEKSDSTEPQGFTREQAMADIRKSLREKVKSRAKTVRKSRHFMPIAAALSVMLVFAFLQYNRVLFSNINAYIVPSQLEPTNLLVDPQRDNTVSPEPKLIIPKVNIDVPVVWDTTPDHESQMAAMEHGVAWFGIPGANSKPGQVGNTVISGHSSNDYFESGEYKFVFAPLHRMNTGDNIYINYESTRYTYTVTDISVVKPTDVDALRYETDKPMLTLITCTPLGTALNRLLITAEQISPDPAAATPAPEGNGSSASDMPGIQPTLLERAFGSS